MMRDTSVAALTLVYQARLRESLPGRRRHMPGKALQDGSHAQRSLARQLDIARVSA